MKKLNILIILLAASLIPVSAFAQSRIEFTPSISIRELYDDNIDLDRDTENVKSDWITSISPAFDLSIASRVTNLNLRYSPSFVRYRDYDNNDTTRHSANLAWNQQLTRHLALIMSDTYVKSEDPLEETEGIVGIRDTRRTYQRNNWASSIDYTFGPSNSFVLGYTHSWLENDDPALDDGKIFDPYSSLTYWFNVKHGMEFSVGYTEADFSRDDNSIPDDDYSGGTSGIKYLFKRTPHATYSISYDYTYRDFEGLRNEEDYTIHESSIGFEHQLSETFSYHAFAGYFIQNYDYSDDDNGFTFDVLLQKELSRGSFSIGANGGWDEVYLEAERRGFTKYQQLESQFQYSVTENLQNYAGIRYRQDKDSIGRKSKTIRVSYGWRWLFARFWSASLDYSVATRDDDLFTRDYSVNRVTLSITWSRTYR